MTNKFITLKPGEFPMKAPSESIEQITFFNQLRKHYPELSKIAIHIKNEGKKSIGEAMKDKAEGLVSGAPDIMIPGSPTLMIEMKKQSKSARVSQNQKDYMNNAVANGAMCFVCYGWEMAWVALEKWTQRRKQ